MNISKVLQVASQEIGYVEGSGNYSKYGEWYGGKTKEFANAPWCATFVSWCFEKAGFPLPYIQNSRGFAYCPYGVSYFKKVGRLYKTPLKGDIVFFDWNADGIADHVGFVLDVKNSQSILTIEGNTSHFNNSNGGEVMKRVRTIRSCLGFARIDVDGDRDLRLTNPLTKGTDVQKLQQQLFREGYTITIDGEFGAETQKAVRLFQQAKGLEVDGIVGERTRNILRIA